MESLWDGDGTKWNGGGIDGVMRDMNGVYGSL